MQPIHRRSRLLKQNPAIAGSEIESGSPSEGDLLVYDATTGEWLKTRTIPDDLTISPSSATNSGNLFIRNPTWASGSANLYLIDETAPTDETIYRFSSQDGTLSIQARTDANGAGSNALVMTRTGTEMETMTFGGFTVVTGKSGTGTGGNYRAVDDSGTSRWLAGILGTASETSWSLYDLANAIEVLEVTSHATAPQVIFNHDAVFKGNSVRASAAIQLDSAQHAGIYFKPDPTGSPADSSNWGLDAIDNGASASYLRLSTATDADAFGASILELYRSGTSASEARVMIPWRIRDGHDLRLHDSSNTDYVTFQHNGTDFLTDFVNTTWWRIGNSNPPTSGTLFRGGQDVRVYDTADNDYISFSHDGTDATIHCHQTTELNLTGATNLNASDLLVVTDNANSMEVGWKGVPINAQTSNYTLVLSDAGRFIRTLGSGITITIPPNSSVAFPVGTIIWFMNIDGTNNTTIAEGTGVGIIGQGTSVAGSMTLTPRTLIAMIKYTTDGWTYIGTP